MKTTYIRPVSDLFYYSIMLLFTGICFVIFWFSSYFDYINMLNNGYINNKSITFKIEEINHPFKYNEGNYILLQYNEASPQLKYVWINGKVKFPPIKQIDDYIDDENIAIIGEHVDPKIIPNDYKLIGYFNAPNSYQLQSDIWLIPQYIDIDVANGTRFVFMTPSLDVMTVFNKMINMNNIEIINSENNGSYSLKSNQVIATIQFVTIFLLSIMLLITATIWLNKESHFLSILYISGFSFGAICIIVLKTKILPYVFLSSLLIAFSILINYTIPLWDIAWMISSFYLIIFYITVITLLSLYVTYIYTVRKGGQKY